MRRLGRSISDRYFRIVDRVKGPEATRARIAAIAALLRPKNSGIELIRLGGEGDGGYLVPDDLDGIAHCFSPGVDDRATFEADCQKRNITSFLADATVTAPPAYLRDCQFMQKNLGPRTTATAMTLDDWVNDSLKPGSPGDLILQMDIEGAEFDVLNAAAEATLSKFRIAVIEFHGADRLKRRSAYDKWLRCFERLNRIFDVVHVHPNNCCGIAQIYGFPVPRVFEVTFLRKDRVREIRPVTDLPHPLDRPNVDGRPDLPLPREWLEPA